MSTRKRRKRKMSKLNVSKSLCLFWKTKTGEIEQQIERQEQYSRKNCHLIHGIEDMRQKVTDKAVVQTSKS